MVFSVVLITDYYLVEPQINTLVNCPSTVTSEKYGRPGHRLSRSLLRLAIRVYRVEEWWKVMVIGLRNMCYYFGGSSVTGANEIIKISVSRIISYAVFVYKLSC